MDTAMQILAVELDGPDGLVVTFSDGTSSGYVVEELLGLRPIREQVKAKKIKDVPKASALKV
jgi:hypothetical protein